MSIAAIPSVFCRCDINDSTVLRVPLCGHRMCWACHLSLVPRRHKCMNCILQMSSLTRMETTFSRMPAFVEQATKGDNDSATQALEDVMTKQLCGCEAQMETLLTKDGHHICVSCRAGHTVSAHIKKCWGCQQAIPGPLQFWQWTREVKLNSYGLDKEAERLGNPENKAIVKDNTTAIAELNSTAIAEDNINDTTEDNTHGFEEKNHAAVADAGAAEEQEDEDEEEADENEEEEDLTDGEEGENEPPAKRGRAGKTPVKRRGTKRPRRNPEDLRRLEELASELNQDIPDDHGIMVTPDGTDQFVKIVRFTGPLRKNVKDPEGFRLLSVVVEGGKRMRLAEHKIAANILCQLKKRSRSSL